MGYDKPDLGFVVHYQAPGSVISYYQQVGRAGRAIERADVVLLRGHEDRRIQDFFIEQAFPPRERVERVLEALEDGGATVPELMSAVNLGRARIEAMLKVLDVEGAVAREGTKWLRVPGSDWHYDGERYAKVTALRRAEQKAMAAFGADGRCLMRALQEELDDPAPEDCGVCAVCTAPRFAEPLDPVLVREAALHLRSRPLVLDAKKMAPDAEGKMKKLPDDVRAEDGRALARLGDGGWDPLVQEGRRAGRFGDELVSAAAEAVRAWRVPVTWVAAVPSRRSGPLVPDFAQRLAAALELPFHPVLERVGDHPPQREMANSAQQVANVRGEFAVAGAVPSEPCLLVDDIRFSGWTLAMVGGQLRRRGAAAVYPFALATAF
jgi:ATP-dependent DNA helicase RecQ